jgi:hypothetical protein
MDIGFNNTEYCVELHNILEKIRLKNKSDQSKDLYRHFLNMITPEEYEQVRWIEIDRFEVYNGAFIFISDEFEDKVIAAFSNTNVHELFSRAW